MEKIKILRIIARLNIGGPAIHVILLTEGLDKARFDSVLICGNVSKDEGDMLYYARQKNVKPILIPELRRELCFLSDIIAFKKIYNIIKAEHPDIIHTHTAKAGTLGRLAAILYNLSKPKSKRIKLIHTFHGHAFSGYFNRLKTDFFIFIERFLAFFTHAFVTVSNSIKRELVYWHICKEDKIKVIPLGFELGKFLSISPRNTNTLNISIIGRLVPIKNHRLFLEAAAGVIRDCPQMNPGFRIIGDGELRAELEDYSRKLNIHTHVSFLGWQKDLSSVYSDSDIVALTSINEGTPVSLIEAMASGKAVVATDVGGVRDLLGKEIRYGTGHNTDNIGFRVMERGIIVKSGDSFNFSRALILLLQDADLRKDMGLRSRDFARDNFTKERLIKDIENLYNHIFICRKQG